ncbi:hypothetical protein GCM10007385_08940 [Tateyamaria omphalii]|nr:hypothetical protein GCM10007385_08940 [Tateyamaria omphalii]
MRKGVPRVAAILGKCHKAKTESKPYGPELARDAEMGWRIGYFKDTLTLL